MEEIPSLKDLELKSIGGQSVKAGNIIVRQRGTKFHPGINVGCGKDHTLFAKANGKISFSIRGPQKKKLLALFSHFF